MGDVHWDALFSQKLGEESNRKYGQLNMVIVGLAVVAPDRGQRGMVFLLHKRWTGSMFNFFSNRVAALNIDSSKQLKIHTCGVYMPHSAQPDEEVDVVYELLEKEIRVARRHGRVCIVPGDFNATVGSRTDEDDPTILGENPMPNRSLRGNSLLQWCTFHDMVLSNTFG